MDTESLTHLFKYAPVFGQIVSLLATWVNVRKSAQHNTAQDFLIWLQENNHQQLKEMLERDKQTVEGIQTLLNENQEALLGKLNGIDTLLAQIASRIEGLDVIARAVHPDAELSEQAVSILRQFNEHRAARCTEVETCDSLGYIFLDGAGGEIKYDDEQFIRDDFATLVELGFMRQDFNSRGEPIYVITRPGSQYAKRISPQAPA